MTKRALPPSHWLSVREAAARANVSSKTIKRWISGGLLPATRLPAKKENKGHLRVRRSDLDALLAQGALA